MATVSVFNITNISPTRTLNFTSAAARDSWFDSFAVGTPEVISSLVDVNAMMVSVPFSGGDILADFTNHYARINQGDVTRYYFITDYRRLNRSQVILNLKLDTVMTFMLSPDSPLQIGSKTLVLREHRDRFNAGVAVYDDMPESTSGEMILKSTSVIAGSSRLHCVLRTIAGEPTSPIQGRPYWHIYQDTASLVSQDATGIHVLSDAGLLVGYIGEISSWLHILVDGDLVVNGVEVKRTNATTQMTVLSIQSAVINDIHTLGVITAGVYLKSDGSLVGSLKYNTTYAANPGVLLKTIGTGNYVYYGQTSIATPTSWAGRASFSLTGNIRAKDDINVYDGAISKYLVLPYTPTAGNACLVLTSLLSSGNYYVYNMVDMGKAYSTTVTLPSSSYTFTTSGTKTPLRTIFEFTITSGRPDTEIGTKCKVQLTRVMPYPPIEIVIDLPDSTAMSIEELRDFMADELDFNTTFIVTTSSTNKLQIASSNYGADDYDGGAFLNFDFGTASDASGTGTRIQTGVFATTRIPLNEPKLYTSQFYLPTVTLAGISVPLYREYIPAATTAPTVAITYNSNLEDVGMIVGDSTNFKTLDEGIRVIQLPNRMPLYATDTSTYFQYIKEYDDRLFNIQQSATARNAAIGSINSALSAVVPMVGNESISTGIAGTRIARAGINIAADIWNAVDNYKSANINRQKSILEMSLSSIDIASTSVEFLIAHDLDKIRFSINSVKTEMLNYLDDLFFYQGYATFEMKVPDFDSRTNFNYLMALVDIDMNDLDVVVSDEILADIYNRFKSGITIFHNNEGFIDWNQSNENWED